MPSDLKSLVARNWGIVFLSSMLAISLSLNLALVSKLHGRVVRQGGVQVNSFFPQTLPVLDEDGRSTSVNFIGPQPSVVYVLSPNCGWCKRNEANIRALASSAGSKYRFVGLSTDAKNLKAYVETSPLPFPVFFVASADLRKKLGFEATPQTVCVAPGGKVQRVWVGAYSGASQKQVESFFGVKLPGLQDPKRESE